LRNARYPDVVPAVSLEVVKFKARGYAGAKNAVRQIKPWLRDIAGIAEFRSCGFGPDAQHVLECRIDFKYHVIDEIVVLVADRLANRKAFGNVIE
jgi:hypothetical protein